MSGVIDIVQIPSSFSSGDLPETLELGVPFTVRSREYVLVEGDAGDLMACEKEDENSTTAPRKCSRYYIVRRLLNTSAE